MAELLPVDPEPVGESEAVTEVGGLKWQQLRQLGMALYPTNSKYGKPTAFLCTSRYVIIGTYSAEILLFNYSQQLVAHLSTAHVAEKSKVGTMLGPVTALNIDADGVYLVAGFALGWVLVFDLEAPPHQKPTLVTAVPPLTAENVPKGNSVIQRQETHLHGTPVAHCCFISQPLQGKCKFWSLDSSGLLISHQNKRLMLDKVTLSRRLLGSYDKQVFILDSDSNYKWGLVALLTADMFLIIDMNGNTEDNSASVPLSIPRSKDTTVDPHGQGCVRFNRELRQIAYTWGNELKHLEFNDRNEFSVMSIYTHHSLIKHMDWIGNGLVILATHNDISLVDLRNQQTIDTDMQSMSPAANCLQITTLEQSVFVLGNYEMSVGQFTNWADRLFGLLNAEKPVEAVKLALHYYKDDGDLSVLGLPHDNTQKNKVILAALPDLIITALQYGLEFDQQSLNDLLPEAVNASVVANLPLLEQLMDAIENNSSALDVFFRAILKSVNQGLVHELPPAVFRAIVAKHPEPKLFYNLSLATLDLDLAFKMCAQYPKALGDVKIFLENQAFHDFVSPLHASDGSLNSTCYSYMAMVLTSRVYPTGDELEEHLASEAKNQIYQKLFMGDTHDLLGELLEKNEEAMLDVLNLGLQDPWFNDEDTVLNRQIIVNVLLRLHDDLSVSLAVFVARNYPKYKQFIVLNGTTLNKIVKTLCDYRPEEKDTSDEQLALLSLLSVFKVNNNAEFIQRLIDARYMLVLNHVFRKQDKIIELASLLLKYGEDNVFDILTESHVKRPNDCSLFVSTHFQELMHVSPEKLGKLVSRFNMRSIWKEHQIDSIEFLDSAYTEIFKQGKDLPDQITNTRYLSGLIKLKDTEKAFWALDNLMIRDSDISLPLIVDDLIEFGRFDVLAALLVRKHRNSEALIYIVNHFQNIKDDKKLLSYYVERAYNICLTSLTTDRSEGLKLIERLLEALLELPGAEAELDKIVQMLSERDLSDIVYVVKYLLDYASNEEDPSTVQALERSKNNRRTDIINELHISIISRERALKGFLVLVQNDSYQDLLNLMKIRAKGWIVPVDGECEVCGGKIVGLGIDAQRLYANWGKSYRQYATADEIPLLQENESLNPSDSEDNEALVLFQCGHSYHFSCLKKMNPLRECIVCSK